MHGKDAPIKIKVHGKVFFSFRPHETVHFRGMNTSKEAVKEWLSNHADRDRHWLAEKCGTEKRTVDNWLSSPQPIPAKATLIIRQLMIEDSERERAASGVPPMSIVLEVDGETFDRYNHAATARDMIIRKWAIWVLDEAAKRDQIEVPANITPLGHGTDQPIYWLDLAGGIAAGSQISTQVVVEPIKVSKDFPAGHYALRVFGRSMEPKIPDGSLIVVKAFDNGFPRKGTIVVYSDGLGSTLKEFGYRKARAGEEADSMGNVPVLRSLNPNFKNVQTMDGGKIEAVFVEVLFE